MTSFWEPLSVERGVELFGDLWPNRVERLRPSAFLGRVDELADGSTWPASLGALSWVCEEGVDESVRCSCLLAASAIAIRWHEREAARIAARMTLELDATAGDQIDALVNLGHIASDLGDSELALEIYDVCRGEFERRGDRLGVAYVDMNVAIVHQHHGRSELALEMYGDAATVFADTRDAELLRACWTNMIGALRSDQRLLEAVVLADRLVSILRAGADQLELANAVFNRANVLCALDRWEDARQGYIEALETYRHLGLCTEQADSLDALGRIPRRNGLLNFAEQMHLEALRLYEGRHHPIDEAIARRNLAIILILMGRHAEAIVSCDLAAGVGGTDLDPTALKAYALDALGKHREAEQLRIAYIERHGADAHAEVLAELT